MWSNVRQRDGGEVVSSSGTHLGHNLPDGAGNRYCINLVCVAGAPPVAVAPAPVALAVPAASPPPPAAAMTTLASFEAGAAQRTWQVTNDPANPTPIPTSNP